jgi:hypothetical protein
MSRRGLLAPYRGSGPVGVLAEAAASSAGSLLACEIGAGLAAAVRSAAARWGSWSAGEVRRDLAGIERDVVWRRI